MFDDRCKLTTKDFTILEVMLDRCQREDASMAVLLRRKLEGAIVMFRDDIPEDVATLNSRVVYSVNGGAAETRILSHAEMSFPVGSFLAITNPRGLALLGLSAGNAFHLTGAAGKRERILLERVPYQPEADRRRKAALARPPVASGPAVLRLVHRSDGRAEAARRPFPAHAGEDFDDPGPSAA